MSENIFGRIPVLNALDGKRKPEEVYLLKNSPDQRIISRCKETGVRFILVEKPVLDRLASTRKHQGAVAIVDDFEYADLEEEIRRVSSKANPLVLMLDGLDDPVNFGSALRSAAAFGVDFVIVRKDRQVGVTQTVAKVSTGASEFVPIVRVTNLASTLDRLKEAGFWSVAAAGKGETFYDEVDYSYPTVIIIGNEGFGISHKILEKADFIAKIPMPGRISSLNASVACAVFLAAAVEQRRKKNQE